MNKDLLTIGIKDTHWGFFQTTELSVEVAIPLGIPFSRPSFGSTGLVKKINRLKH